MCGGRERETVPGAGQQAGQRVEVDDGLETTVSPSRGRSSGRRMCDMTSRLELICGCNIWNPGLYIMVYHCTISVSTVEKSLLKLSVYESSLSTTGS